MKDFVNHIDYAVKLIGDLIMSEFRRTSMVVAELTAGTARRKLSTSRWNWFGAATRKSRSESCGAAICCGSGVKWIKSLSNCRKNRADIVLESLTCVPGQVFPGQDKTSLVKIKTRSVETRRGKLHNNILRRAFSAFFIVNSVVYFGGVPLDAREPVRTRHAMVVASQPAEQAGVAILRKGGNAIDAAVAVGFALASAYPFAQAIGGGGFMTIRLADGTSTFIDFREEAPGKASRDMYLDASGNATRESSTGWKASGVPGTVRGFEMAQKKYGKLKWAEDLEPAITMASKGFPAPYALAQSLQTARSLANNAESKRVFQRDGKFYEQGDIVTFPDLAREPSRELRKTAPMSSIWARRRTRWPRRWKPTAA